MPAVVLYFQVHQPYRLRGYTTFDTHHDYFDDARNAAILRKVAEKCYRPATQLLLDHVRRHKGRFRVAFSITGAALEQLEAHTPDVLDLFRRLADTGACEFLAETYHHSLACLYTPREFAEQIDLHTARIQSLFNQTPTVFRNTELIYSNDIARLAASITGENARPRFRGMLAEGVDALLAGRSPDQPFLSPAANLKLLLRNYRLSDDIAFRFSDRAWDQFPLTAAKFASWLARPGGPLRNLFLDYETFGEHQWTDSGIFEFLAGLPDAVLANGSAFMTPSEALSLDAVETYEAPSPTSWADTERDLSAWCGNAMQAHAVQEHAALEPLIRSLMKTGKGEDLMDAWRRLGTSDHFYYMSTKHSADGKVHRHFNPYESPYDSYINAMNILDNLRLRASLRLGGIHDSGGALPVRPGSGTMATAPERDPTTPRGDDPQPWQPAAH